jgi:hypothetical protein
MRFAAMFVAGLLLMQLPATASIVSPASQDMEGPNRWNVTFGYLAWDANCGVFRLSASEVSADFEPAELRLASNVSPCMCISGLNLPALGDAEVAGSSTEHDLALFASFSGPTTLGLESLDLSANDEAEAYSNNIHIAATSVCPEPATLAVKSGPDARRSRCRRLSRNTWQPALAPAITSACWAAT